MYHFSWKKISRVIVNKTIIITPDEFTTYYHIRKDEYYSTEFSTISLQTCET